MKVFRNKNYTKRNYECTNVIACVAEIAPDNYEETDESIICNLTKLYTIAGVSYYGYL